MIPIIYADDEGAKYQLGSLDLTPQDLTRQLTDPLNRMQVTEGYFINKWRTRVTTRCQLLTSDYVETHIFFMVGFHHPKICKVGEYITFDSYIAVDEEVDMTGFFTYNGDPIPKEKVKELML